MAAELTLEQIIAFLVDAPMFGDLDSNELSQIVHIMQVQQLRPGQWVFREGDPGDAWYVVYEGEVEVVKEVRTPSGVDRAPSANGPVAADVDGRVIAVLGRRACFGEMAILDGSPRSASVRATRPLTAFRFPRQQFSKLLADGNLAAYKLVYQISLVLVSRQRRTTHRLFELLAVTDQVGLVDGLTPIVDQSSVAE